MKEAVREVVLDVRREEEHARGVAASCYFHALPRRPRIGARAESSIGRMLTSAL
jgi:hypothetical protein